MEPIPESVRASHELDALSTYDDLLDGLRRLVDAAAAAGVPIADVVQSVIALRGRIDL